MPHTINDQQVQKNVYWCERLDFQCNLQCFFVLYIWLLEFLNNSLFEINFFECTFYFQCARNSTSTPQLSQLFTLFLLASSLSFVVSCKICSNSSYACWHLFTHFLRSWWFDSDSKYRTWKIHWISYDVMLDCIAHTDYTLLAFLSCWILSARAPVILLIVFLLFVCYCFRLFNIFFLFTIYKELIRKESPHPVVVRKRSLFDHTSVHVLYSFVSLALYDFFCFETLLLLEQFQWILIFFTFIHLLYLLFVWVYKWKTKTICVRTVHNSSKRIILHAHAFKAAIELNVKLHEIGAKNHDKSTVFERAQCVSKYYFDESSWTEELEVLNA